MWSVEPEVAVTPREAFFAPRETVAAGAADGRIAAQMVVPYPPGIPAIAPGEVVRAALVAALREAAAEGTRIAYCADPKLAPIQVVALGSTALSRVARRRIRTPRFQRNAKRHTCL